MNNFLKKFRTDNNYYLFAGSVNIIFRISEIQYYILDLYDSLSKEEVIIRLSSDYPREEIIAAYDRLERLEQDYHLLKFNAFSERIRRKTPEEFRNLLKEGLTSLNLEITEECNWFCRNCPIDGENHRKGKMPIETAMAAIDFLNEHHENPGQRDFLRYQDERTARPHYTIGFTGGEPLLRFDFIKLCVEYSRTLGWNRPYNIEYILTTNGLLLDQEKIDFFLNNNFSFLIIFPSRESVGEKKYLIRDYEEKLQKVNQTVDLIQQKIKERITAGYESVHKVIVRSDREGFETYFHQHCNSGNNRDGLLEKAGRFIIDISKDYVLKPLGGMFPEAFIANPDLDLYSNGLVFSPVETNDIYPMHLPGKHRPFIDIEGYIHTCELIDRSLSIGNVHSDYDHDRISELWNQYADALDEEDCRSCVAVTNCSLCFIHLAEDGLLNRKRKINFCDTIIQLQQMELQEFCATHELIEDAFSLPSG